MMRAASPSEYAQMPRATSSAVRPDDAHRIAPIEAPDRARHPRRQQALALHQCAHRAFVDGDRAGRLQGARDPLLARATGVEEGTNQVQRAPSSMRFSGC
jgi:hypothetical protein